MNVVVDFCGEQHAVGDGATFTIGRDADLVVDDNPFLHRRFLAVDHRDGLCWISNVGSRLAATISDRSGRVQAWLGPGASLPLVFDESLVRFSAGSTTYELEVFIDGAPFSGPNASHAAWTDGEASELTVGDVPLTPDQFLLIVALSEPLLREGGRGRIELPSNAEAAARLDWKLTRFNRKLDNVCEKLTRAGVRGLHGSQGNLAANRRARLVEYAVSVGLVTAADLALLGDR